MSTVTVTATVIAASGLQANLPNTGTVGQFFFCYDTSNLYVWNGTEMTLVGGDGDASIGDAIAFAIALG